MCIKTPPSLPVFLWGGGPFNLALLLSFEIVNVPNCSGMFCCFPFYSGCGRSPGVPCWVFSPYPGGGLGSIPRNTASIWLVSWFLHVSTAFSFHQEWRFFVSVRKCLLAHLQLGVPCQFYPRVSCGVEWAAYFSCWPEFTGMLHLVGCFSCG